MRFLFLILLMCSGCLPAKDDGGVIDMGVVESGVIDVETPAESKDERPFVNVYSTENCPPCRRLKQDVDRLTPAELGELPFVFVFTEENPAWVTGFPTLHWETPDGWVSVTGWNGLDKFLEAYGKPLSGSKKKDDITSQSEPSTANKSSPSSSASEQHSSETAAETTSSQSATESSSSYRKRRR